VRVATDKVRDLGEEIKTVGTLTLQLLDLYYNAAVARLAIFYHFDPCFGKSNASRSTLNQSSENS